MRAYCLPLTVAGLMFTALGADAVAGESSSGDIAIKGYDPVSYFVDHKAVRGSEAYSYRWLGATWLFNSDGHRRTFAAAPASYAPQYGGGCAEAMAVSGAAVIDIDPESWQVIDGKLYLSGKPHFQNRVFDVTAADRNWRIAGARSTDQ
jgi:YHS domain-containing protein